ncbi:MAG: hypothetical protein A2V83_05320 [Nitrospirae bacterium RBG_16_64_22]|nr:MAG: hypothetical protein A2V83_05320 [Nitrospirae bacterium RBG_16_64_22]
MSFFAVTALVIAVINTFLGIFVLAQKPEDPRHRTYAAYCVSLSFWSGFYFLWLTADSVPQALLFARLMMAGATMIPVLHYHHVTTLFGRPKHHAKLLASGYSLGVFFLLLDPTGFFIQGTHQTPVTPYWPTPGVAFPFYLAYFFAYLALSTAMMFKRRRETTGIGRTQLEYILISTVVGYIGGSTNFPLWYDISILPYGNILVPLVTAANGYILIRYRLLDVHTIMKRGLAYGVTLLLVLLPLFGIALFAQKRFFGAIDPGFSAILLAAFGLIAVAFYRLKARIESAVSRSFFASSHEVTQSLAELARAVVQMLDLREIGQKLAATIATATGAKSCVLFVEDSTGYLRRSAAHPPARLSPKDGGISPEHAVCQVLKTNPLILREEVPGLRLQEAAGSVEQLFAADDFALLLAFREPSNKENGRLIGFCGIGQKESRRPYTADELKYLETLASQAAVAMENARLHEFHLDAQKQLERIDRLKGIEDVVSGLSHEIRNPLTSIKMFLQLLPQIRTQEDFVRTYYQAAIREMARIERLITELINLSRPKPPRLRKQPLNTIIESVVVLLKPTCRERSIELQTDLDESLPHVPMDEDKIRQVLINLILNAVEAVEGSGGITIATRLVVSENVPFARLTIADTGKGIRPDQIERIFTPFYTTKTRDKDRKGTGLGLSIVHRLIQEHSGTIDVESTPGRGTTFVIMLPIRMPPPPEEARPEDREHLAIETPRE